jgi:hypothetical protein
MRSTFSNLDVKLPSTLDASADARFKLGRLEKFGKYSRGAVGVAGMNAAG